ncbi:MAG: tetratricopeptide repeat protein [Chitinophagales bacterium]|nr:tetratricopeptide repeat protein [Chitinophagales bacterium]MBP6154161.1 tetratricopeptide repeat protein [Chitinophagales bacterium]HQV77239.1 tetratricopeptide repeat protein [Chitinophagales bacterium]HRB69152.1 tetratricopeptide repeat protein [Chitinophagales bacterium]HRB91910.1 tetratricopeptide repeat protein [Chitinophagales bacterium]
MSTKTSFAKKKKKQKSTSTENVLTKEELEQQAIFISGVQAYLLGNSQDAITKFNEVLRRNPKNDVAYYELSRIAFESRNMDKAIEMASKAIDINPNNEYYYQYLAEAKGEKGDFAGAAKTYEKLIKLKPKEYDYYYDWAYMLSKAEQYENAIDVYNALEKKIGIQEELIFQKQPLFIKLGKIEDCVQDIEKLAKAYPDEIRYIGLIGEVYQANKMYDKAIQIYHKILATDANNADALLSLAETYRKKGDDKKHDEIIQQIFKNEKIDIDTKILSFIPYIERLTKDSSLKTEVLHMADLIVAMYPNDVKAVTARADVLYNIGKKKDSQAEYDKAIELSDVPNTVWIQLYILDTELEDYDHLLSITEKGMTKIPNDPFGYFYHAIAQQQKNNHQATSDVLMKAFARQKMETFEETAYTSQLTLQMLIALGDASFQLKNFERTDSCYEAALEIDPNNATVLNNYAYYLSERDNKLEKAERMSKKSNLLVDNNSAFLDTYAWIMFKMKNFKEALVWIEQAMDLPDAKDRAELLTHYGDILFKVGEIDKAVEQWKMALQKGGDKSSLENRIKNRKIN